MSYHFNLDFLVLILPDPGVVAYPEDDCDIISTEKTFFLEQF